MSHDAVEEGEVIAVVQRDAGRCGALHNVNGWCWRFPFVKCMKDNEEAARIASSSFQDP